VEFSPVPEAGVPAPGAPARTERAEPQRTGQEAAVSSSIHPSLGISSTARPGLSPSIASAAPRKRNRTFVKARLRSATRIRSASSAWGVESTRTVRMWRAPLRAVPPASGGARRARDLPTAISGRPSAKSPVQSSPTAPPGSSAQPKEKRRSASSASNRRIAPIPLGHIARSVLASSALCTTTAARVSSATSFSDASSARGITIAPGGATSFAANASPDPRFEPLRALTAKLVSSARTTFCRRGHSTHERRLGDIDRRARYASPRARAITREES